LEGGSRGGSGGSGGGSGGGTLTDGYFPPISQSGVFAEQRQGVRGELSPSLKISPTSPIPPSGGRTLPAEGCTDPSSTAPQA